MAINVCLIDDHTIIRESLRALLEQQPDIKVVGEAADGKTAVALVKKLRPNIATF